MFFNRKLKEENLNLRVKNTELDLELAKSKIENLRLAKEVDRLRGRDKYYTKKLSDVGFEHPMHTSKTTTSTNSSSSYGGSSASTSYGDCSSSTSCCSFGSCD